MTAKNDLPKACKAGMAKGKLYLYQNFEKQVLKHRIISLTKFFYFARYYQNILVVYHRIKYIFLDNLF